MINRPGTLPNTSVATFKIALTLSIIDTSSIIILATRMVHCRAWICMLITLFRLVNAQVSTVSIVVSIPSSWLNAGVISTKRGPLVCCRAHSIANLCEVFTLIPTCEVGVFLPVGSEISQLTFNGLKTVILFLNLHSLPQVK